MRGTTKVRAIKAVAMAFVCVLAATGGIVFAVTAGPAGGESWAGDKAGDPGAGVVIETDFDDEKDTDLLQFGDGVDGIWFASNPDTTADLDLIWFGQGGGIIAFTDWLTVQEESIVVTDTASSTDTDIITIRGDTIVLEANGGDETSGSVIIQLGS